MAKQPKPAKPAVAPAITEEATNVVPLNAVQAGGSEPPQSALHAKVIAYCDSIRKLTTDDLHSLAVECLKHGAPAEHGGTGDLRPLWALQNNLPNSLRKLALANWAVAFAPIAWGKKDAKDNMTACHYAKAGAKNYGQPWRLDDASKVAFFDAPEAEKARGITDIVKQLMSQNSGYEKLLSDPSIKRKDGVTDEKLHAAIALNKKLIAASAA